MNINPIERGMRELITLLHRARNNRSTRESIY